MKKRNIIENLYRFIIENQVVSTLEGREGTLIIIPYTESGRNYETGITIKYSDGFNDITRQFYFPDTMEEEFIRYINRHVIKGELQREWTRLNTPQQLGMTG